MIRAPSLFALLLLAAILVGCAPAAPTPPPSPVVALLPSPLPTEPRSQVPTPLPFRFDLPTPAAAPVSGWRPPLYPVPWAISPYDHFYFVRPIAANQVNWPLADYRYGGIFFAPNIVHTGVDIPAPEGTPIHAAGPGTVVWAGWGLFTESPENKDDPYGLAVAIRHDFGYKGQQLYTAYAHMSRVTAVFGSHVETGDLIGYVGATGATTGPHLHFEVRLPDNSFYNTFNPELWTAPPEGWGVLAGRLMDTRGDTLQQVEVTVENVVTRDRFLVKTYGGGSVNHDPYYDENLVLGDIPAGLYKVSFRFEKNVQYWMEVLPGQVTFFTYQGDLGFAVGPPSAPRLDFLPVTATASPAPTPLTSAFP